jgi:hypothetical protein
MEEENNDLSNFIMNLEKKEIDNNEFTLIFDNDLNN